MALKRELERRGLRVRGNVINKKTKVAILNAFAFDVSRTIRIEGKTDRFVICRVNINI